MRAKTAVPLRESEAEAGALRYYLTVTHSYVLRSSRSAVCTG